MPLLTHQLTLHHNSGARWCCKDTKDVTSKEALKLYSEGRNISNQEVSLIVVRDQTHNTLNLVLPTNSKVVEMKMDMEDIPIPDMIHFHK